MANSPEVPNTDDVLESLVDMRIPLSAVKTEMAAIGDVITSTFSEVRTAN